MADLVVRTKELNEHIKVLEQDNLDIYEIIKTINLEIKKLDKTKWDASEKKKLDDKFNIFFDKVEKNYFSILNNCTDLLKHANTSYINDTDLISKKSDELAI